MSKENMLNEFRDKVAQDESLQKQLQAADGREDFIEKAAQIAEQLGIGLSAEDFEAALKIVGGEQPEGELTEAQLDAVAGGAYGDTLQDTKCMKLYGWCPGQ